MRGTSRRGRRVLILAADVGSGHLVAARALAADLEGRGFEAIVEEDLRPSLGIVKRLLIREGSVLLFSKAPRVYDLYYRTLLHVRPARAIAAASLRRSGARRLLRLVRRHEPDVVVSTYPGVTVALGELRRRRRMAVPAVAVITDLAGLFFWAHRGVDHHLVAWAESLPEVERIAPDSMATHIVAPTDPAFLAPDDAAAARRRLRLDGEGPVIVVSGGGWGVGELGDTVAAALRAEPAHLVVLAGNNEAARRRLSQQFANDPRVRVHGFTDRVSELLAAADVLVHATAGVTCLEAALRGCPTVIHGFSVGHVRHNAEAMARLGLAHRATGDQDLPHVLRRILDAPSRPDPSALPASGLPTAADVVTRAVPRIQPLPRWRVALQRLSPVTAALFAGAALSTPATYAVAAHSGHEARPIAHVRVRQPEVAMVLSASPADLPTLIPKLRAAELHVSVPVTNAPSAVAAQAAQAVGVELVPALDRGTPLKWVKTISRLEGIRRRVGGPQSWYVTPPGGYTLGQYVLGRAANESPIRPRHIDGTAARPGDIIEVDDLAHARRAARALSARGIRAVTVEQLLQGR